MTFTPIDGLNYIDAAWQPALSGSTFASHNPAQPDEVIGHFPASNGQDVDAAVAAAKRAFKTWRLVPTPKRGEILFRAAHILESRKADIAQEMTREMGKVRHESQIDIKKTLDMMAYVAGEGRRLFGQTTPSELHNKFCMTIRQPLGVVACITPWNFPMAAPSWKILPALLCGNTVVYKPAPDTPLMGQRLVEILLEAGLLPGVINLVQGTGVDAGEPLVTHPDVALVSFTGSCQTGRRINTLCAPSFKRVSLEMGGKNATLVLADANLDKAADSIIKAAFAQTGQICTATSRVIVDKAVHAPLRDKLLEQLPAIKPGDTIGPLVNEAALNKTLEYIELGKSEGATLLYGGQRESTAGPGWFVQPTLFDDCTPTMRLMQEEIFGPVLGLIPVDGLEEALAVANSVDYGLSCAIHTTNINHAFTAMRQTQAGLTSVNLPTIGAEVHMPFGGTKISGNGHREGGTACLDVFTEYKTLYIDHSDSLQRAQID